MSEYCHNCGKTISEDTDTLCHHCKSGEPALPVVGEIFRLRDEGDCKITRVWKSRFGDWKVSFEMARGGGGIFNLDAFNALPRIPKVGFEAAVINIVERAGEDEQMMNGE